MYISFRREHNRHYACCSVHFNVSIYLKKILLKLNVHKSFKYPRCEGFDKHCILFSFENNKQVLGVFFHIWSVKMLFTAVNVSIQWNRLILVKAWRCWAYRINSYKQLYQGRISPNLISGVMTFILTEEFSVLMNNICTH